MHVDSQHLLQMPALPVAGADVGFGLGQAPRGGEHQRPREVCCAVVEHARRVGRHHAARSACRHVNVVIADRDIGNDFQARTRREQRVVDAVGQAADDPVLVLETLRERRGFERLVRLVGFDFAMCGEISERFIEDFTCDENFRFHCRSCGWSERRILLSADYRIARDGANQVAADARQILRQRVSVSRHAATTPISDHATSTPMPSRYASALPPATMPAP